MVQEMSCSIDIAYVAHLHLLFRFETEQWRIQGRAPPLFVAQTVAQRAEKQFFETAPPPPPPPHTLSEGLDSPTQCVK